MRIVDGSEQESILKCIKMTGLDAYTAVNAACGLPPNRKRG